MPRGQIRCLCSANVYLATKMKELQQKRALQFGGPGGGEIQAYLISLFGNHKLHAYRGIQRCHGHQKGLAASFNFNLLEHTPSKRAIHTTRFVHCNLSMCRSVLQCKEPLTLDNLKAIRNLKGVGNKIQAEIEQILVTPVHSVGGE